MNKIDQDSFGLSHRDTQTIRNVFIEYPLVTLVYIFGSRAKNTFHSGSDIDLAIMNTGVDHSLFIQIKREFDNSNLPFFIDLVNFPELTHPEFIDHINRVGKIFYKK
jgi:predicted nucleotidyltransferase